MSSKHSQRWLKEHFSDIYVKKAQQSGYRSRATFKLLELQERDHLFKPGMVIVDLGAAPGGWSQVVTQWVGNKGKVIALDVLPIAPLAGVDIIQADFTEDSAVEAVLNRLNGQKVDWVLSDMAPNISGNASVDIPQALYLAELAVDFAYQTLRTAASPGSNEGGLLVKVFQGEGFDQLLIAMRAHFQSVVIRKPKASRSRSREVYLLARGCGTRKK